MTYKYDPAEEPVCAWCQQPIKPGDETHVELAVADSSGVDVLRVLHLRCRQELQEIRRGRVEKPPKEAP